jgi:hypothetical protein
LTSIDFDSMPSNISTLRAAGATGALFAERRSAARPSAGSSISETAKGMRTQ